MARESTSSYLLENAVRSRLPLVNKCERALVSRQLRKLGTWRMQPIATETSPDMAVFRSRPPRHRCNKSALRFPPSGPPVQGDEGNGNETAITEGAPKKSFVGFERFCGKSRAGHRLPIWV
jgi:hypothetical protein